jgi:hypothetical protein
MAIGQHAASIRCPVCQNPMTVPVESIIDVQQRPELKAQLLQGQLNMFPCPSCGNAVGLASPLLYHDSSKELLLCLTPANTSMKGDETQKLIGNLTNTLMNSLPPEKRKAYLFQPRIFLTLESMIEAILEADGITKEMLQAQKTKVTLIDRLLAAKDNDAKFKTIVAENESVIDTEFFQMLAALISAAQTESQKKAAQDLLLLRRKLMPLTKAGQELAAAEQKFREELVETRDELLRRLIETSDKDDLETLVRIGRPYMDYSFFQELTAKIDSAKPDEAKRLTKRREQILEISERQDEETKEQLTERVELLKKLLQAGNPEPLLKENLDLLDETFFAVLSANVQQAAQAGQKDAVAMLQNIAAEAMEFVRENAPPVIKLINELMDADSPQATEQILKDNAVSLSPEFFETVDELLVELKSVGQAQAAERLQKVAEQAKAFAT